MLRHNSLRRPAAVIGFRHSERRRATGKATTIGRAYAAEDRPPQIRAFGGRLVPEKNFHLLVDAFLAADLPADTNWSSPARWRTRAVMRFPDRAGEARTRIILAGAVFGEDLCRGMRIVRFSCCRRCMRHVVRLAGAAISGAKIIASDIPANVNVCGAFARIVTVDSAQETAQAIAAEWRRQRTPRKSNARIRICQRGP